MTGSAEGLGVPAITLSGDRHTGRVGGSVLTRVGLADLVAETKPSYIDKAAALAGDLVCERANVTLDLGLVAECTSSARERRGLGG